MNTIFDGMPFFNVDSLLETLIEDEITADIIETFVCSLSGRNI
jgi:hypothetical protein